VYGKKEQKTFGDKGRS